MNFNGSLAAIFASLLMSFYCGTSIAAQPLPAAKFIEYSLPFGSQVVGEQRSQLAYLEWDCGANGPCSATHTTTFTGSTEFSIVSTTCNAFVEIPANSKFRCSYLVKFQPASVGAKTARIKSGGAGCSGTGCHYLNPSGTGVLATAPPPPNHDSMRVTTGVPDVDAPGCKNGSIIDVNSQVLREVIPVMGVPFKLVYSTDKVPGRLEGYRIRIPVFGAATNGFTRTVQATAAGGVNSTFTAGPTQTNSALEINNWNGGGLTTPTDLTITTTDTKSGSQTITTTAHVSVGQYDARRFGLGGVIPDNFGIYNHLAKRIFWGNGATEKITLVPDIINGAIKIDYSNNIVYRFDAVTGYLLEAKDLFTSTIIYKWESDSQGRLTSYKEATALGQPDRITSITRNGSTISVVAPYNQTTTLNLNSDGWVTSINGPGNLTHTLTYVNSAGLLSTFQRPGNQKSNFLYGPTGLLIKDTDAGGVATNLNRTAVTNGWKVVTTTSMGITESYQTTGTYGFQTSQKTINGKTSKADTGYGSTSLTDIYGGITGAGTSQGPLLGEGDRYNNGTNFAFGIDQPVYRQSTYSRQTVPSVATLSNWTQLKMTKFRPAIGAISTEIFDKPTNTLTTTSALGFQTVRQIGSFGRITSSKEGPYQPTTSTYNNLGQLTELKQGARQTTFTYNSTLGLLASVANSYGQATSYTYDSAGRVITAVDPSNFVTNYTYTPNGKLATVQPAGRPVHTLSYNLSELLVGYVPAPLANSVGNISYTYDADGRRIKQLTPSTLLNYTYSGNRILSVSGPNNGREFTQWDGAFLTDSQTIPDGVHTKQEHRGPLLSRETTTSSTGLNQGFRLEYNNQLGVSRVALQKTGSDIHNVDVSYDKDLRPITIGNSTITYNNATNRPSSVTQGTFSLSYTFDEVYSYQSKRFGELINKFAMLNGSTIYISAVNRDISGRISSYSTGGGSYPIVWNYFTYDASSRLQTVERNGLTTTYNYDANGNRLSKITPTETINATYDAQDRLLTYGNYVYTYNDNGERVTKTDISATPNQITYYTWDELGQLRSVLLPNGQVVSYDYDVLGRRIAYKVNGVIIGTFVWLDQTRLLAEFDGQGNLKLRYVYGLNGQTPDYAYSPTQGTLRILTDPTGSVRRVVSIDGGAVDTNTNYDEFGVRLDFAYVRMGFAGGLDDPFTKLVRFGNREYDPEVGRFLSRDPTLFGGRDTNLYGYAFNDPVNFIDINGLWSIRASAYALIGGGITFGVNPDGRPFFGWEAGIGAATGVEFDPQGKSPGFSTSGSCPAGALEMGLFAGGGLGAGFVNVGPSANVGVTMVNGNGKSTPIVGYGSVNGTELTFSPQTKFKLGLGAAAGVQFTYR